MATLLSFNEIKRRSILGNPRKNGKSLRESTVEFLETYLSLRSIDEEVIVEGITRGIKTVQELAVFYLNFKLEQGLGRGFFIEGKNSDVLKKFEGISLFDGHGPGPVRWAVGRINKRKADNFGQAWRRLSRDRFPKEGLFIVKDSCRNNFLVDLSTEKNINNWKVANGWAYGSGKEFFVINVGESLFFVEDQGQGYEAALQIMRKKYYR